MKEGCKERRSMCEKEVIKRGEVGFSVFKSLAEERILQLPLWFLGNRCECVFEGDGVGAGEGSKVFFWHLMDSLMLGL